MYQKRLRFFIQGTFLKSFWRFFANVFLFLKTFVENTIWNHFRKNGNKLGLYDCFCCCSFFILGCCSNVSVCLSVTRRYCIETDKDIISKKFLGLLTPSPHMVGYNKNVLYLRPITLAKRYLRFYRCHGPYIFDKTGKVFICNICCFYTNSVVLMLFTIS